MFCTLGPRRICENAKGVFLGISTCDNSAMNKLNLLSYGCAYDVGNFLPVPAKPHSGVHMASVPGWD